MITWASLFTLATGVVAYASSADVPSMLMNLAELGGVLALFALVCATESFN
ncbi:hypothetical protein [Microvirga aerophila]|jgi:hypothetical protein|uniref:Uncharacterized protein n=1 Tax=Microvirga aerophila TaxID=670291 RepID=A0A512C009_9HYPH|nr:hypothetical protein [Microvirga aerophila]GEO17538.1 hypothetical protein MAE02_52340 [Microvirga aerophila]